MKEIVYSKEEIDEAMDYIIDQTGWANHFPDQCHERIRMVCESMKNGEKLPFKEENQ